MLVKMEDIKFKELMAEVKKLNDCELLLVKIPVVGPTKPEIVSLFVAGVQSIGDDAEGSWLGPASVGAYYNKITVPDETPEPAKPAKAAKTKKPEKASAANEEKEEMNPAPEAEAAEKPVKEKKKSEKKSTPSFARKDDLFIAGKVQKVWKSGSSARAVLDFLIEAKKKGVTAKEVEESGKVSSSNLRNWCTKILGECVKFGYAKKEEGRFYIL